MRGERLKVMRELTCELDDRTRLEYGTKLVHELDSISKAKAAIKYHQKEAERLVSVLSEGFEIRPVECQEIPGYADGVMRLCRLDTYATLSEREMTDEERNGNLFADETKAPEGETNQPENETISDQVDPETAAQADADAAIEKQISEEDAALDPQDDPTPDEPFGHVGPSAAEEEAMTQADQDRAEAMLEAQAEAAAQAEPEPEQEPAASPEPVAEVRPRRRKQGRRA